MSKPWLNISCPRENYCDRVVTQVHANGFMIFRAGNIEGLLSA